jgi:hypothetical protein
MTTTPTVEREPARAKEPSKRWRNVYLVMQRVYIDGEPYDPPELVRSDYIWPSPEIAEQNAEDNPEYLQYLGPEPAP